MIVYFSGTGNSRFISNGIAGAIGDEIVDATKYIKAKEYPSLESSRPYVFVAPTYAWQLPRVFEEWVLKSSFSGSDKAYFVLTCGDDIGAASVYIKKLALKKKFTYMGTAKVVMPENYIAMFSAPDKKREVEIITEAKKQLPTIINHISLAEPFEMVPIAFGGRTLSGPINNLFYTFSVSARKFYATDACIACGACASNCMLNNIKIIDGKPHWGKNCTHCMACINYCPLEAIEYGSHTKGLRRYTFKD